MALLTCTQLFVFPDMTISRACQLDSAAKAQHVRVFSVHLSSLGRAVMAIFIPIIHQLLSRQIKRNRKRDHGQHRARPLPIDQKEFAQHLIKHYYAYARGRARALLKGEPPRPSTSIRVRCACQNESVITQTLYSEKSETTTSFRYRFFCRTVAPLSTVFGLVRYVSFDYDRYSAEVRLRRCGREGGG